MKCINRPSAAKPHNVTPPHIDCISKTYSSRSFLIRYQQETFKINEVCVFVTKLAVLSSPKLLLEVDLMYTNLEFKTKNNQQTKFRNLQRNPSLEVLAVTRYIISNPWMTDLQFLPLSFEPDYICSIDALVHIFTSNYSLGKTDLSNIEGKLLFYKILNSQEKHFSFSFLINKLEKSFDSLKNLIVNWERFYQNDAAIIVDHTKFSVFNRKSSEP